MIKRKYNFGFTLIELLIVIAIISILSVVVLVALDPVKRFADARDARRSTDVGTLLTAIHTATVDNKGTLPAGLSPGMPETQLGSATSGCAIATGGCNVTAIACLDLNTPLAKYLKTIPIDPKLATTSTMTNYSVQVDTNGIVTVRACGTEGLTYISTSR